MSIQVQNDSYPEFPSFEKPQSVIVSIEAIEEAARNMADRWNQYAQGHQQGFGAYFMLENSFHRVLRPNFLAIVDASPKLPDGAPDPLVVLRTDNVVLEAFSHTDEQGQPFDVQYTGRRLGQTALSTISSDLFI